MTIFIKILITAVGILIVWLILAYNKLVSLSHQANEAWSDIDVQLKRRYDLIPNLVTIVKGYSSHEKETLEKVTQARTVAMRAQTVTEKGQAENLISDALKSLFAVSEDYPDLKANQNFLDLQRELSLVEDQVQMSRRFYNGAIRDLNIQTERFPSNIVAKKFGFTQRDFFQLAGDDKAKDAVVVNL